MMLQTKSFITIIFFLFFNFSITSILYSKFSILTMAENQPSSSALYIVHTEQPTEGVDHEAFHLQTLSSVLGSEEAAKESLIYVYKSAATGFSAKLTPEQVSELESRETIGTLVNSKKLLSERVDLCSRSYCKSFFKILPNSLCSWKIQNASSNLRI
ncbi:subtilisin-like protease SBT3.16 isoform X3 [Amaranthus tricolor]|uniref:subtilisin-like protease SBT3.16 isoform X3 n=1 Tax=Amaranthus tricolor TaxID=29722 RepID=UPI00258DD969|nr:subtilisin-like protease SBT3.16 isoform X3 [Amaranthus tricolor]